MKLLKNIIVVAVLVLSIFSSSCLKEYEEPNNLSDVSWYISNSENNNNQNPIMITQDDVLGFVDTSQGYISHAWHVSSDSTYMLNGPITGSSSGYDEYIDETISHTTDDETIAVLFKKEGIHTVRLRNTFSDKVKYTFNTGTTVDVIIGEYWADYVDGLYVIDTTFTVEVFGSTFSSIDAIVSTDKYFSDIVKTGYLPGSDTEMYSVDVEFGKSLYLKDNSSYKPNTWSWTCTSAGIKTAISGETISMPFYKIVKNAKIRLTVQRDTGLTGWTYAKAISAKSQDILLNVNVVTSSDEDPSLYDVEMGISDLRTLQVVMKNTPFDTSADLTALSKEILEGAMYAYVTVDGGSPQFCTAVSIDDTCNNKMNLSFGTDATSEIFGTGKNMRLTVSELPLNSSLQSSLSFENKAVDATWLTGNLLDNSALPYGDLGDIDNLFDQTLKESGLDTKNPKYDTLDELNNNILFTNALYKFISPKQNDYGGNTVNIGFSNDPISGSANDKGIDATGKALRLELVEAAANVYFNQLLAKSSISRYYYQCNLYFVPPANYVASDGVSVYVKNGDSGESFAGTYDDDGVGTLVNSMYYSQYSNLNNAANGYKSGFKPFGNKSTAPYTGFSEDDNLKMSMYFGASSTPGTVLYLRDIEFSNDL